MLAQTSLATRWDGSHLVTAWAMVRDMELYFPWYERTRGAILHRDVSLDPQVLDHRVQDLLKLGESWREVCSASLDYPTLERVARLRVPCLVADRAGNEATEDCSRRLAAAVARCTRLRLPDDPAGWMAAMAPFLDQGNPLPG